MSPIYVFLAAYWAVLVAESLGDKMVYTVAALGVRFRARVVLGATVVAFAAKMLAAVLFGAAMVELLSNWAPILSAVALFISGALIWFRRPEPAWSESLVDRGWARTASVSFASIFFSEWGDPGQIAAAALAAQSKSEAAVWLGATLALITKMVLSLAIALKLRAWLSERGLRGLAAASCCALGLVSLAGLNHK